MNFIKIIIMFKNYFFFTLFALFGLANAEAQNVGINNDGSAPNPSAILDIKSATKGILIPRIILAGSKDTTTIATPAVSLLVYNMANAGTGNHAVYPGFYFWNGTEWQKLNSSSTASAAVWMLGGNTGTNTGTDFIGTTDSAALEFRVNNKQSGKIDIRNANTFFGYISGQSLTTGANNAAVGYASLTNNTTGGENSAVGKSALNNNTTGSNNTGVGFQSLTYNTTGFENSAVGRSALLFNTTGNLNTALGRNALWLNTTGSQNTALGYIATVTTGELTNATAIGARAAVACSDCMVLGSVNGVNGATGNVKVGVGTITPDATLDIRKIPGVSTANFYGSTFVTHFNYGTNENTYIRGGKMGAHVVFNDFAGAGNIGIGTGSPAQPLSFNSTPGGKISFYESGATRYGIGIQNSLLQLYTGFEQSDIAFGWGSSENFNEAVRIKANKRIGIGTNDPQASLDVRHTADITVNFHGSEAISHFNFGVDEDTYIRGGKSGANVLINDFAGAGNVGIGTNAPNHRLDVNGVIRCVALIQTSDARMKKDIQPLAKVLDKLKSINAYTYRWKDVADDDVLQIGFIAQELKAIYPELVITDKQGMMAVNYSGLVPVLLKAIKEQQEQIDALRNSINRK
jgi:hypothetical protein